MATSAEYKAYIRSPAWRDVKRRYRSSRLPQGCYVCGCSRIEMHHKTYKRFGAERLTDLLPLCSKHHAMTHKVVREARAAGTSVSTINYWNAAKRVKRQQKGK